MRNLFRETFQFMSLKVKNIYSGDLYCHSCTNNNPTTSPSLNIITNNTIKCSDPSDRLSDLLVTIYRLYF